MPSAILACTLIVNVAVALLPCVEVEPAGKVNSSVIWLHGLGADGHDFEPIVPELHLPSSLGTRFVFPHAPSMPVTINNNHAMPAWYDIFEMVIDRRVDTAQLEASAQAVSMLIEREIERGVAADRLVVAGFSQGGAVGYQVALTYPEKLAGLMALSTYFATRATIAPHPANANLPIYISHGDQDPVVPEALGQQACRVLLAQGYRPHYETYPMGHGLCSRQIEDISRWLQTVL